MDKSQQWRSSVVSIIIAEANRMNCQLVETALRSKRSRVTVIGTAVSSERVLDLLKGSEVGVAIISARLEEGPLEGYRLLRQLRLADSRTRTIMLLDFREEDSVIEAFRCGARGVVFRDEPLTTLSKCIHAVYGGQFWVNSEHLGLLIDALGKTPAARIQNSRGVELLSKRQEDVVRLVAQGLTNRDVSGQLRLSEHTVRNYLFRIYDKLGVSTRVELALYYLQATQCNTQEIRSSPPQRSNGTSRLGATMASD